MTRNVYTMYDKHNLMFCQTPIAETESDTPSYLSMSCNPEVKSSFKSGTYFVRSRELGEVGGLL